MSDMITIEGSQTPSVELARGKRRTVQRTERIDRLIQRGYVIEVKDEDAKPAAAEPVEDVKDDEPTKAPRRAAAKPADGE